MNLKTKQEIEIMTEGGKKLGAIRDKLMDAVDAGVGAYDIEMLAQKLIVESGGEASFMKVTGYKWATCINVNEGIVHGIPHREIVFKKGDVVSVDVGLYYKGLHTDTSSTKLIGSDKNKEKFLGIGKLALEKAISQAQVGNRVVDISETIEDILVSAGTKPIEALTGHGVGKSLHEDPYIPCFVTARARQKSPILEEGLVLAIEIMYTQGNPQIDTLKDGWTIVTKDGKISALFEETVAVTKGGPIVLTSN